MKIDIEHVALGLALVVMAYMAGRRNALQPTAAKPGSQPQAAEQWWSYAGQW